MCVSEPALLQAPLHEAHRPSPLPPPILSSPAQTFNNYPSVAALTPDHAHNDNNGKTMTLIFWIVIIYTTTIVLTSLASYPGLTDPEDLLGAGLSVSISSGNGLGVFGVSPSGQLFVADRTNLVYETVPSRTFTLGIQLGDSGAPTPAAGQLSTTQSLTVNVGHVNKPPRVTSAPCAFTIAENASPSSAGALLAADADTLDFNSAGDRLTAAVVSFLPVYSAVSTPNPAGSTNPQTFSGSSVLSSRAP